MSTVPRLWQLSIYPGILASIPVITYFNTEVGKKTMATQIFNIWSFVSAAPNSVFLSVIVSVEAVFLGIAIPIVFQAIQRISEYYETPYINRLFISKKLPIATVGCLTFNILLVTFLIYFDTNKPPSGLFVFFEVVALFGFIVSTYLSLSFFKFTWKYTTDTEFVVDEMFYVLESTLEGSCNE